MGSLRPDYIKTRCEGTGQTQVRGKSGIRDISLTRHMPATPSVTQQGIVMNRCIICALHCPGQEVTIESPDEMAILAALFAASFLLSKRKKGGGSILEDVG